MKLYVYETVNNTVVATFEGATNEECESQARAANYDNSDDYGWTYSPAFGAVDGLKTAAAE